MTFGICNCSLSHDDVYTKLYQEAQAGSYTSYLRGKRCLTEEGFFQEISASFQFPWYFGENWSALDECLCDLEWLRFARIFIVVDDFSKIFGGNKSSQKLLCKYLSIMVEHWNAEGVEVEVLLNN